MSITQNCIPTTLVVHGIICSHLRYPTSHALHDASFSIIEIMRIDLLRKNSVDNATDVNLLQVHDVCRCLKFVAIYACMLSVLTQYSSGLMLRHPLLISFGYL